MVIVITFTNVDEHKRPNILTGLPLPHYDDSNNEDDNTGYHQYTDTHHYNRH